MVFPHELVRRIERFTPLDKVARPLAGLVGKVVRPRRVRNLLSGTKLGHPVHPMLTDLPIGAWSMSALLDTVGGTGAEPTADLLVGVGILGAVPTAMTGLNDWSDTIGADRRVGVVHAGATVAALGLYLASLIARCGGRRGRGKLLGLARLGVLMAGGYLGGHLSFARAVNVNHTTFEHRPQEWTPVLADAELGEGEHRRVSAGGAAVLLVRDGGQLYALANTCSHAGGPLDEGELVDGCVVCPWHASTFRLTDGSIVRGPASIPQPAYQTRVSDGKIEVRSLGE
ncbi:MAG TPA: Rieske 2Fe-2S domain-containing protein [Pseudonocardiaceae bacterium]|nr:Rieske 2Fe-2S domain-containing protein [Pseudonocardiaceae bacterium]